MEDTKSSNNFKFNCLCCDREVSIPTLSKVTSSEHLCNYCRDLPPKLYFLTMELTKLKKEVEAS